MYLTLFPKLALFLSFASLALGAAIPVARPAQRAKVCNGRKELCTRSYGNVTYIGAHNSYAASKEITSLGRNQELDVIHQLSLGVRLLQAQAHDKDGELHFCHTNCGLFDGGKVVDYFKKVKKFLDKNPSEVVTLIVTNPEGKSVKDVWQPAFNDSGLIDLAYVPPHVPMKQDEWPTLGEMVESGKRLVVFMDAGANISEVDFILPEFQMVWESPFGVTDPSFPCTVDRVKGPLSNENHMYMINHSLNRDFLGITIPDFGEAEKTNSISSIIDHAARCAPLAGERAPNFVLIDWVGQGKLEPFKAADELNGFA